MKKLREEARGLRCDMPGQGECLVKLEIQRVYVQSRTNATMELQAWKERQGFMRKLMKVISFSFELRILQECNHWKYLDEENAFISLEKALEAWYALKFFNTPPP